MQHDRNIEAMIAAIAFFIYNIPLFDDFMLICFY